MLKTYSPESIFEMNPNSKVWVYVAKHPIAEPLLGDIMTLGHSFVKDWAAHGTELDARFSILNNQVIVLAVDQSNQQATGCSIDSSVQFIKQLDQNFQLDLFERMRVLYKNESGDIQTAHLQKLNGEITENSLVFDHLADTIGSLKTAWKIASNTWVARFI